MEPAKSQIMVNYVIYTTAQHVENMAKEGEPPSWWVQFEGSWESLYFGTEKPFGQGDKVKISFEKVQPDAIPNKA